MGDGDYGLFIEQLLCARPMAIAVNKLDKTHRQAEENNEQIITQLRIKNVFFFLSLCLCAWSLGPLQAGGGRCADSGTHVTA